MIVILAEMVSDRAGWEGWLPCQFRCLDEGATYSAINADRGGDTVQGSIIVMNRHKKPCVSSVGVPEDRVRVIVRPCQATGSLARVGLNDKWEVLGYVWRDSTWREVPVLMTPIRQELFSRTRGLFENELLTDTSVFVAGVGSVGSVVALDLAKQGIINLALMDHDRMEVANLIRHVAGLSDIGRYKVFAVADAIHEKNPHAKVLTCKRKIDWDTYDLAREYIRESDLTICAADGREGRLILNKLCVEENKPIIFVGAFRRAYGGQILSVIPHQTPCYQCFLQALPENILGQEAADGEAPAYSDRPIEAEPGLSNDISPLSQMVVKLALQRLIAGKPTALHSLDEDLVASWYIWLNRREAETGYSELEPLGFHVDGMHILRWYGVNLSRDPACQCCGDLIRHAAEREGFEITAEDMAAFTSSEVR